MSKALRNPYRKMKTNKLVGSRKARGSNEARLVQVALDEGLRPQREMVAMAHTLAAHSIDWLDRLVGAASDLGHRFLDVEEAKLEAETELAAARHESAASVERARIRADGGVKMIDRLVPVIERAVETMKTSHPDAAADPDAAAIDAAAIIQAASEGFMGAEPDHEPEPDADEPEPRRSVKKAPRRRSH